VTRWVRTGMSGMHAASVFGVSGRHVGGGGFRGARVFLLDSTGCPGGGVTSF
jgi:hypothetical protein